MIRYLWDEAHGGHYSVSGPFEQCPEPEVIGASAYYTLWNALLACRAHLATPAADSDDLAMIDQIDAAMRGEAK